MKVAPVTTEDADKMRAMVEVHFNNSIMYSMDALFLTLESAVAYAELTTGNKVVREQCVDHLLMRVANLDKRLAK